jgi:hypothetical protein
LRPLGGERAFVTKAPWWGGRVRPAPDVSGTGSARTQRLIVAGVRSGARRAERCLRPQVPCARRACDRRFGVRHWEGEGRRTSSRSPRDLPRKYAAWRLLSGCGTSEGPTSEAMHLGRSGCGPAAEGAGAARTTARTAGPFLLFKRLGGPGRPRPTSSSRARARDSKAHTSAGCPPVVVARSSRSFPASSS